MAVVGAVMMDRIDISGLTLETGIGTYDWEQDILQTVRIDLTLYTDTRKAGQSDDLHDAVDYHAVCQQIESVVHNRHFQLVEAMAESIATAILSSQAVDSLSITVAKPGALTRAESVSVTLERSQAEVS
jgi:FolB domain-containing protein